MISEKKSWKGFKISKNLWSAIKKCIYVLVPAVLTELVTNNLITAGIAGLLGPMVLNAIEFYFKEVTE